MTAFADTRPEYAAVWKEGRNPEARDLIRRRLAAGTPTVVTLQPGDGTKYRFLLVPTPDTVTVSAPSHDGRERMWEVTQTDDVAWFDGAPLLVTFHPDGQLGSGVAMISPHNKIDGIRHRIDEGMTIPNGCTAEALARTIEAVWSKTGALHAV